ncbi:MAG: methyltransferase domain-containing protein [Gaiella sp.]
MSAYDAFAPVYDAWVTDMTEDVPFYVDLARQADGPVVELAVGTGRVAVPMAEAIGRPVIGLDASPAMLERARIEAVAAGVELDLRLQDMRELALDEPAALIVCPFRSLLHLPTWADRRRVFERVAASLRPGGRFAWNAFVFDPVVATELDGGWRELHGVRHHTSYDPTDCRIDLTLADGATITVHWVAPSEWDGLLDVSGLELEARYGWFDRRPYDADSRELVAVARRPS